VNTVHERNATEAELAEFRKALLASEVQAFPDWDDRDAHLDWLRRSARALFVKHGVLDQVYFLRLTHPHHCGFAIRPMLSYDQAHLAPMLARHTAQTGRANHLVFVSEMWLSPDQPDPERFVQPRLHPERREAIVIIEENPRLPDPIQVWLANISRDAQGKATLHEWVHKPSGVIASGRVVHLLPDEAYGKKAHA
jgi:hypothetical protein